jgi:hypothetical protein
MPNPNPQLSAAATAFQQWRSTRAYPKVKTPEPLRQQAVALLAHFPASTIIKALKINGSNFKRWSQLSQIITGEAQFITLPCVEEPIEPVLTGLNLEGISTVVANYGCKAIFRRLS